MAAFHEVEFPIRLALGLAGGPSFNTEISLSGSGAEQRIGRWQQPRRSWNAAHQVSSLEDLHAVVEFFYARRGRLHGFRFLDPLDNSSARIGSAPSATDQVIGVGNGSNREFTLQKTYGEGEYAVSRPITKPVSGSTLVAVAGTQLRASDFTVDTTTGRIKLLSGAPTPHHNATITAGFRFHVPARFDTDSLAVNLSSFDAGEVPDIPIIELRHT